MINCIAIMDYLPATEEQTRLGQELAALSAQVPRSDRRPTICVLPTARFFPDEWTKDGRGIWRLCERLMAYAGLSSLEPVVMVVDETEMPSEDAVAVFHGIEQTRCYFRVRMDLVDDPMALAATLAHEVAHAYRDRHGLVRSGEEEELLTDLTTVYLGFGVLTLNAAHRYSASGSIDGSYITTTYSHQTFGYLSPQSLAYLLALQCVAGQWSAKQIKRVTAHLSANQATFFKKALKVVQARDASDLRELRATLPPIDEEPEARAQKVRALDEARHIVYDIIAEVRALDETRHIVDDLIAEVSVDAPRTGFNRGRPTFRVRRHHGYLFGSIGAFLGLAGAILVYKVFSPSAGFFVYAMTIVVFCYLSYWVGSGRTYDVCSDRECEKQLPPEATRCPRCGGNISGVIKNANERLEAEEALQEKRLGNLLGKNRE